MPLSNKSIVNSLLSAAAGSLLATHSASAAPLITTVYNENTDIAGGDFSETFETADSLPGAEQISGDLDGTIDADFFKIPGLTSGATFNLSINYLGSDAFSTVRVRDDIGGDIGTTFFTHAFATSSSGTITGTVPTAGNLIVDIQHNTEFGGGSYSMNLSVVPEPATATVSLLGAAAVALAVRSRKKVS